MMLWELILLVTSLTLIALRLHSNFGYKKQVWLNGPAHFPLLGGALTIGILGVANSFNDILTEVCSRFGSICGFFAGKNYFVFVNEPGVAERILRSEEFTSRFPTNGWASSLYGGNNLGILHSHGNTAKKVRDSSISKLRIHGTGRPEWTSIVQQEVLKLKEKWSKLIGSEKSVDICLKGEFTVPISHVTFQILTGERVKDEKNIISLIKLAESIFNDNAKFTALLFAFPSLRFIPNYVPYRKATSLWKEARRIFKDIIDKKRKSGTYRHNNPADFIESFLKQDGTESDDELIWICTDILLTALTGLVANNLEWAFLFILSNPNVQKKIVEEVDRVIGCGRSPTLNDKIRMPYTEATILETLRMGSVVSYGMRAALHDVTFEGYQIPKGTQVVLENSCLKRNPEIWDEPHQFRPERFLNDYMKIVNVEKLIAFGQKRTCLGESIAKSITFLFLTTLLQNYTFRLSSRAQFKPAAGIIGRPQPFSVTVERKDNMSSQ